MTKGDALDFLDSYIIELIQIADASGLDVIAHLLRMVELEMADQMGALEAIEAA